MNWYKDIERRLEGHPEKIHVFYGLLAREDEEATREQLNDYARVNNREEVNLVPAIHTLQANFLVETDTTRSEETYRLTNLGEKYLRETIDDFESLRNQLRSARKITGI